MKVAVVTGGNKGIGFCIVRNLCKHFSSDDEEAVVYLTSRDAGRGTDAVQQLNHVRLSN
jgi:carbonyl reductase 1